MKDGERLLRCTADGFDERRESSCSCGKDMRRRDAELQSDAQRLRQRHPPSASLSGERGEGGRGERGASCPRD